MCCCLTLAEVCPGPLGSPGETRVSRGPAPLEYRLVCVSWVVFCSAYHGSEVFDGGGGSNSVDSEGMVQVFPGEILARQQDR